MNVYNFCPSTRFAVVAVKMTLRAKQKLSVCLHGISRTLYKNFKAPHPPLSCYCSYEVFCNSNIFRRKRPHNTVNSDQPSLFSERHFKGITNTLGIVTRIFKITFGCFNKNNVHIWSFIWATRVESITSEFLLLTVTEDKTPTWQ